MTDKPTLDDFATYPNSAEEATADAMARRFTATAQLHWQIAMDHPDGDKSRAAVNMFTNCYGIAYLLREQPAREGDRVARELWETWNSGMGVGVDVWNWLAEYGIDPRAINRIAAQLISEDAAKSDPAPASPEMHPDQTTIPSGGEA
jgi:hypothetical protein